MIAAPLAALSRVALCAAVLAIWPAGFSPAAAQSSIKVLVNDEPITSFDIKSRAAMLKVFTRGKEGEKQAMDQLIEEALMVQEAKRRNVTVSDEEVEAEFGRRAAQTKMTPQQFDAAMRQAGIDPKTFREFIHANMIWREIIRRRFRATVDVTDQDIAAALENKNASPEEQRTLSEYRLQQILFVVPSGSGAGVDATRRNEANAFRAAFAGCDNSLKQAGGRPGIVVKPTVRREESAITGTFKDTIAALPVGGITPPEKVEEGYQLIAICAKNQVAGQTEATQEVREEISNERGQLMARRYLRDLRSDAVIEYR